MYEVVEEYTRGLFWLWIILSAAHAAYRYPIFNNGKFVAAVMIVSMYPIFHILLETEKWLNEVYVVCENDGGGGHVWKFHGWQGTKTNDDAITASSPAGSTWMPVPVVFWIAWQWFTGERFERVTLQSQNHSYITGRRMPPEFYKAVTRARGNTGVSSKQEDTDILRLYKVLSGGVGQGLIDRDVAKALLMSALNEEVMNV